MDYLTLDPPLFPERGIYHAGETGDRATKALVQWAQGGKVSPYGLMRHEEDDWRPGESWEPMVTFRGDLDSGFLRWTVTYRRADGDPETWGMCSGYSTAEDAAYAACTLIEERERGLYVARLVVGIA